MADPRALLREAETALKGASSGWGFFGGREEKYDQAAELFKNAANAFRLQKQGKEAGIALEKAASIHANQLKAPDEEANIMLEAFKVYRKDDPEAATRCGDKAIAHYCRTGNFRRAAQQQEKNGEVYEIELGDEGRAAASYEKAAEWYESDNAEALANKLWLKTADLVALEGKDYYKAIGLYEKVAKSSINNNLMRWSVKEYLLKAGICQLCTGDMVGVNVAMDRYRDLDPSFTQQREHQLLVDLAQAVQEGDQDLFADKLFQYDQLSKLDKWKTTLLLRIKSSIEEATEDFS